MEHHSNDLPWRRRGPVVRAAVTPDGRLDEDDVDRLLGEYGERIALVTVSGASNVTGFVQPIHRLAQKAHAVGARILVDAAQLAPHRRIDVKAPDDPEHLDYVVLSAHKMYAPFGTGALVGRQDTFLQGAPEHPGAALSRWSRRRTCLGRPARPGGSRQSQCHRRRGDGSRGADPDGCGHGRHRTRRGGAPVLRARTIARRTRRDRLRRATRAGRDDRVGVIAFNVGSLPHSLVAAILGYEGGIGVRSGCFCAQSYVAHLLGRATEHLDWPSSERLAAQRAERPGMVRISLGIYNTRADIDALVEMLERIDRGDFRGRYRRAPESGDYLPVGYKDPTFSRLVSGSPVGVGPGDSTG